MNHSTSYGSVTTPDAKKSQNADMIEVEPNPKVTMTTAHSPAEIYCKSLIDSSNLGIVQALTVVQMIEHDPRNIALFDPGAIILALNMSRANLVLSESVLEYCRDSNPSSYCDELECLLDEAVTNLNQTDMQRILEGFGLVTPDKYSEVC